MATKSYRSVLLARVPAGPDRSSTRKVMQARGLHGAGQGATVSALIRILESATTPPPPTPPPSIKVDFSGSIEHAKFHVTGKDFLPDRPDDRRGVAIRVVDANILIETRREFTGSSNDGKIDHVIEGHLRDLAVNAAGFATVAISATDGRPDPNNPNDFLWSNTERKNFSP